METLRPLKDHFEEAQNDPFESEPKKQVSMQQVWLCDRSIMHGNDGCLRQ